MDPTLGQIFCFASNFVPANYLACDGTLTPAAAYPDLAKLLGGTFGGDGTSTFALPKLPPVATVSGAAMSWIMVAEGTNPDNGSFAQLGEVRPFALPPTPNSVLDQDWRKCDGRLLNIKGLEAMFSLVGTTFGGDGVTTFALPKLTPLQSGSQPLDYYICVSGLYPSLNCNSVTITGNNSNFTDYLLAMVCLFAYAPGIAERMCGFALAQGQVVPINQNTAVFSLVFNLYGAPTATTFVLPNVKTGTDPISYALVWLGIFPSRG